MGAAICWLVASTALASTDTASRKAWCIEPANLSHVIASAEVLGFGVAAGADARMIDLAGSGGQISLREWQRRSPADFQSACDDAYDANFGLASPQSVDQIDPDEELWLEKLGLATVPALFGAVAGAGIGSQLSKRARKEERSHQQALALEKSLADLTIELDHLIAKTPSESVTGEDKLAVRRRAAILLSEIPPSLPGADRAVSALDGLIVDLAQPKQQPGVEANLLETSKRKVWDAVNHVISER